MAEFTPQNESSLPIVAGRPSNYEEIRSQIVGPNSGDPIIAALENTPNLKRGKREQPSVMKYPEDIGTGQVPHVMQFKIFWRWERPDLENKLDKAKEESQAKVETLKNLLENGNFENFDIYSLALSGGTPEDAKHISEILNDARLGKIAGADSLGNAISNMEGWEAKAVLEQAYANEQSRVETIDSHAQELLGKRTQDADERLALRAGVNEVLANTDPTTVAVRTGTAVAAAQLFANRDSIISATRTGGARAGLRTFGKEALKAFGWGTAAGVVSGGLAALAKYTQAAPVYDQMVSIYLPMCTKVDQTDTFVYKDASMAVASGLMDILGGPLKESATQAVQGLAVKVGDSKGLGDAVSAFTGTVINPRLEKIFKEKNIREFNFSWEFYPRSPREVEEIRNIIDTLRYHSHPAISMDADAHKDATPEQKQAHTKIMLRVPAEYEIRFMSSSDSPNSVGYQENPYIPKIGRCVITNIQANYTPNGVFSTFTNNAPTAVTLTITVQEVTQLTREHVEAGY